MTERGHHQIIVDQQQPIKQGLEVQLGQRDLIPT